LADELASVEEVRAKEETKALAKLRERIRFLERENGDLMNKNKAMLDQVKMWRRKCEKLEAK
jgi:predicted RNase H-like nuclease (RuvC/YqgF family)